MGIDEIEAIAGLIHIFLGGPLEAMLILRHRLTSISEATSVFTLGLIACTTITSDKQNATPIMHVISAWIISNLMHPKPQITTLSMLHKKPKFLR